jgi:DNA-binding GntR family transcriptional regulator
MSTEAIPKIAVRTRRDEAVFVLRRMVLSGALPTGMRLTELDLAERLGVSRATVREAVGQLVSEGTLTHEHYRGVRVSMPTEKALADTAEVRAALEKVAAVRTSRVLAQGNESSASRLEDAVKELRAARTPEQSVDLHLAFHRLVHELAGSPVLARMWQMIETQIALALRLDFAFQPSIERLDRTHEEYLEALLSGNEERVRQVVDSHVLFASDELLEMARRPANTE